MICGWVKKLQPQHPYTTATCRFVVRVKVCKPSCANERDARKYSGGHAAWWDHVQVELTKASMHWAGKAELLDGEIIDEQDGWQAWRFQLQIVLGRAERRICYSITLQNADARRRCIAPDKHVASGFLSLQHVFIFQAQ